MESVTTPPYLLAQADALRIPLADRSVHCVVTSPPYFSLRDYGVPGQIGLEKSPAEYVARLVTVFREVARVLRDDGTLWLNLGDSFASDVKGSGGSGKSTLGPNGDLQNIGFQKFEPRRIQHGVKTKDLLGIPWRVAFALQDDGWYLRMDNIWFKPNPMPESVRDRPSKAHEYVFLLTKSPRYYYDIDVVREDAVCAGANPKRRIAGAMEQEIDPKRFRTRPSGRTCGYPDRRNHRSVWKISTVSYKGAHFATFPPKLVEPCVKAGTSERGCCPACGAPWVREVERKRVPTRPGFDSKVYEPDKGKKQDQEIGNRDPARHVTAVRTLGWQPSCRCEPGLEPSPCVVLDPFAGSGTAVAVARNLGRLGIGLDLSRAYLGLASERVEAEWLKTEESRIKSERPHKPRPKKQRKQPLSHAFLPGMEP